MLHEQLRELYKYNIMHNYKYSHVIFSLATMPSSELLCHFLLLLCVLIFFFFFNSDYKTCTVWIWTSVFLVLPDPCSLQLKSGGFLKAGTNIWEPSTRFNGPHARALQYVHPKPVFLLSVRFDSTNAFNWSSAPSLHKATCCAPFALGRIFLYFSWLLNSIFIYFEAV